MNTTYDFPWLLTLVSPPKQTSFAAPLTMVIPVTEMPRYGQITDSFSISHLCLINYGDSQLNKCAVL